MIRRTVRRIGGWVAWALGRHRPQVSAVWRREVARERWRQGWTDGVSWRRPFDRERDYGGR